MNFEAFVIESITTQELHLTPEEFVAERIRAFYDKEIANAGRNVNELVPTVGVYYTTTAQLPPLSRSRTTSVIDFCIPGVLWFVTLTYNDNPDSSPVVHEFMFNSPEEGDIFNELDEYRAFIDQTERDFAEYKLKYGLADEYDQIPDL